jgi:hypothetical protein
MPPLSARRIKDMSEQALRSVASGTGTFTVLKDRAPNQTIAAGGNPGGGSGKLLPDANAGSRPNLEQLAGKLNQASLSIGRDLHFQVDMETGRSVIQVLDRETGEIIRQIPEDKVVASLDGGRILGFSLYDEMA